MSTPLNQHTWERMLEYVMALEGRITALEGAKGKGKKKRALPTDWQPNESHAEYAREQGVRLAAEATAFRTHAEATGRVMKDWDAAFRMWLTNAPRFGGGNASVTQRKDAGRSFGKSARTY